MQYFNMMVGLPASGKSTCASIMSDDTGAVVHSSDAIRQELLGNENDQTKQELVFQTLHERVLRDLSAGKSVIYDATNINYKRRMEFLRRVKALKIPDLQTVCLLVLAPYEVCVRRNNERERTVPEAAIRRMYEHFDIPMEAEGWDKIQPIFTDYVDDDIHSLMIRLSKLEHDNPHHDFTVGQHCMTTQQYLITHYKDYDKAMYWAALLHDIGKEKTKVFHDAKGNPSEIAHFYNHERVGAYDSFFYTGSLEKDERIKVALLIRWHMRPYAIDRSDNPSKTENKVKNLLGDDIWNQITVLNDCDRHAH